MVYKGNCPRFKTKASIILSPVFFIILLLFFLFILYLIHRYKPMGMLALCREKFGTAYMHPEKWHKAVFGLMWSVIGEVFFLFVYYYYYFIIFIFVLYSKNQLLVRLGVLGFCLLTPTV